MTSSQRVSVSRFELLTLFLVCLAYAVPVVTCWNLGYLDFGDGNYMYISWRLSQGAVLYRDILAPQPPGHLYLGAAIAWVGEKFFSHPIWAFRTFSLLLHLGTVLVLWRTSKLLFASLGTPTCRRVSLLAVAIYLVLPIGFWWTLGYQSQPLLILALLVMFHGVIRMSRGALTMAGAAGGLALLTNMTAAPYVLFTAGWLLLRNTKKSIPFVVMAALPPLVIIPFMEIYTGSYISDVVRNQVGAFPRADVLAQSGDTITGYILNKLITEGGDVLRLEGSWVVLGLLGMAFFARKVRLAAREYALFFSFFSLCSIFYVAKGGTVDYVFSLAEPYVALFAGLIVSIIARWIIKCWNRRPQSIQRDFTPLLMPALVVALLVSVTLHGMAHNIMTLQQQTYELPEAETLRLVNFIKANSKPNNEIIAPPHLAFLARRKIAQDYSEHFLWRLKYMNERLDNQDGRAVKTINAMAQQLKAKELPVLVLDMNQTGIIPEIISSVESNYKPLLNAPLKTLNTPLQLYRPQ